jgi:hypothetical protein
MESRLTKNIEVPIVDQLKKILRSLRFHVEMEFGI